MFYCNDIRHMLLFMQVLVGMGKVNAKSKEQVYIFCWVCILDKVL